MPFRGSLSGAAAVFLALLAATPVTADCDPVQFEEGLAAAPVAFVGAVTALDGAVATFKVVDIWAGDVAEQVDVRGLTDHPDGMIGEDDRQWQASNTYLVVPIVDGDVLRDSICTATSEWTPELEQFRPADARIVAGDGSEPAPIGLIGVGVVILAVAGASAFAFRRQ
jgi:hypothetical protein